MSRRQNRRRPREDDEDNNSYDNGEAQQFGLRTSRRNVSWDDSR